MSEHREQVAVVEWFEWKYPKYQGCLLAYPSGFVAGGKNKFALISKLKLEGWRNGVSDLFLAVPKGPWHGLWLEMKDRGKKAGSVSDEQWRHIHLMIEMGYSANWAAGADNAIAVIENYMETK